MPRSSLTLAVQGTVRTDDEGVLLVLSERLDGYDTFLTGTLDWDGRPVRVRIITLDDVTVLRPVDPLSAALSGREAWAGSLHMPHGVRAARAPEDLVAMAAERRRDLAALDAAELRYAVTFLAESTTPEIRAARIAAITEALPPDQDSE